MTQLSNYNRNPIDSRTLDGDETVLGHLVLEQKFAFTTALQYLRRYLKDESKAWEQTKESETPMKILALTGGGIAFIGSGFGVAGLVAGGLVASPGLIAAWWLGGKADRILPLRDTERALINTYPQVLEYMAGLVQSGHRVDAVIGQYDALIKRVTASQTGINLDTLANDLLPQQSTPVAAQTAAKPPSLLRQRMDALQVLPTPQEGLAIAPQPQAQATIQPSPPTERSLFLHLADNPFLCYFILASQRTGKTSSAAAATLTIKRESGTEIYYINLSDHGQGNQEAFAHATGTAIGNINGGNPATIERLIQAAIEVVEQFHASNNAILVVDEWVSLATKGRTILDEFWSVLAPKADALTSNGIGCGRSVWAIAPRFQAATMRDDAKVVKNFVPLLLSIAPQQLVEWKNPHNGTVAKLTYNGALIGQAINNWKEAGITEPLPEQIRQWKRTGASRIFWADKQWSALGQAPALPTPQKVPAGGVPETVPTGETVAKLERDLEAKQTPPPPVEPEIDLLQICIEKLEASDRYITLAKLKDSMSAAQKRLWDEEFEVLLLEDERVNWVDVPISGGRISTRLEYVAPNDISE